MSLARFFRRGRWDRERTRELESYIDIETDENIARGMTPEQARAAARRKLGSQVAIREEIYQMNTIGVLDEAWRDLKFGARLLRLNPGFAAVAVLSLALGIGANTAIFQLLDAVRLRTLPVVDPETLVDVRIMNNPERTGDFTGRFSNVSNPLWERIRDAQQVFSSAFAWGTTTFELSTGGDSQPAEGLWVSGEFFSTLGVTPVLGRALTSADDRRGCGAPSAVISYAFWQRRFGGDPAVIGRMLNISHRAVAIVGVTPASFYGLEVGRVFDVAVPLCAQPLLEPEREQALDLAHFWWLSVVGRLKPGLTITQASAQLAAISPAIFAETLPSRYTPETARGYTAFKLGAVPAGTGFSQLRTTYEAPLWILLAIAALVLLIACGNLANLMLARASVRQREIAVRLAIGASRGRVIRQLVAESTLIAAAGAGIGIAVAAQLERVLISFLDTRSLFLELQTDWRVLAFTIAMAAVTCVVFGALPALRATTIDPGVAMKSASRGLSEGRERLGMRRVLVVAQVSLSLVLVVGALLFVRTLANVATVNTGFQSDGILVVDVDARPLRLPVSRELPFQRELVERVRHLPGVDAAAAAYIVPLSGYGWNDEVVVGGVRQKPPSNFNQVGPGFFDVLGIPILAGRDFDQRDAGGGDRAAIVSESFVRMFLGRRDAIGTTFTVDAGPGQSRPMYHIVGVVKDTKYQSLREDFRPLTYVATAQDDLPGTLFSGTSLLIRSRLPLPTLIPAVKHAVAGMSPELLVEFEPFTSKFARRTMRERLMAALSGFFGGLAALLAMIGLYGVMSYSVARRRHEIAIRIALGARRDNVIRMVMREASWLLVAGLAIGGVLAVAAAQATRTLLFGLKPGDPLTLAAATGALMIIGLLASYVPALRASRLHPTEALHDE